MYAYIFFQLLFCSVELHLNSSTKPIFHWLSRILLIGYIILSMILQITNSLT